MLSTVVREDRAVDAAGVWVEGHASYPGRSVHLPRATGIGRCWEGWSEVSRGRMSRINHSIKGRTRGVVRESRISMTKGEAEALAERSRAVPEGSDRKSREYGRCVKRYGNPSLSLDGSEDAADGRGCQPEQHAGGLSSGGE